ncbi:sensor histidine kinase [Streptomyces durhamensis]|nr:hypothetical protein [Streptomyces durhamensis]
MGRRHPHPAQAEASDQPSITAQRALDDRDQALARHRQHPNCHQHRDCLRKHAEDEPATEVPKRPRTGVETLTTLQRLVGLLRDADTGNPDRRPMSGRIEELIAGFGRLGRPVETRIPGDLAGPAAEAIHGIVREALTNVLRCAPGAAASVVVWREGGVLRLSVDNGPSRNAGQSGAKGLGAGRGVSGMRERAASVGGELTAGPTDGGGWRVLATLPDDAAGQPPEQAWRRDVLREQRFTDPALAFAGMLLPLSLIVPALASGLQDAGWGMSITEIAPRMARLIATDPVTGEQCELDVLKEIFHRPPARSDAGPVLSRDDAVGLKVRALHDRGFPRDVIDVYSARDLYTTGELERLGAQHDEDFDLEELHGRLEAVDFTSDREYAAYGMSPGQITDLRAWVQQWHDDLGLRLAEPYDDTD